MPRYDQQGTSTFDQKVAEVSCKTAMEVSTFVCSICNEASSEICVYCTKDACLNHLCARCFRCSDCCACDMPVFREESNGTTTLPEPEVEVAVESITNHAGSLEGEELHDH